MNTGRHEHVCDSGKRWVVGLFCFGLAGIWGLDSKAETKTFRDDFEVSSYGDQTGSQNWSSNWIEYDPRGGGADSGNIKIRDGRLSLNDHPDSDSYPSILRCADLSTCDFATLSFEYDTSDHVDPDDRWRVQIRAHGGDWIVLDTFSGQVFGTAVYDISEYISAETCVRFQVENRFGGEGEYVYLEWVEIFSECKTKPEPEGSHNVRDDFDTSSYSQQDGRQNWSSDWIEADPRGGGAYSGNIKVRDGHLRLNDYPDSGSYPSISRCTDLSSCSGSATLSFKYGTSDYVDPDDRWSVQVKAQGGNWTVLDTFSGQVSGTAAYDISDFVSKETCVRFQVYHRFGGEGEYAYIEWVEISSECQMVPGPHDECSVRDGFDTSSYSNQDGTEYWSSDWVESDPRGGGLTLAA